MHLADLKFLFLDCQTTGATPDHGDLLEIAWTFASASDSRDTEIQSHLVRPDSFDAIPSRIRKLTGISDDEVLLLGRSYKDVHQLLNCALVQFEKPLYAIIHFGRFERPFLEDLYVRVEEAEKLPFDIVCTHEITKRLFPNLPARSLRALAGYFNEPISQLKRAECHVRTTHLIWKALVGELEKLRILTLADLLNWLGESVVIKKERHEYPLQRMKRLELTQKPGIYKMLARNGDVLYVGKATSLKARVNSYFRGRKGRDGKKLEMLTQVWDINVTECESPLEAALLETDEIKRLSPPYNVSLQAGNRKLFYASRDFLSHGTTQSTLTPYGPFTSLGNLESIGSLFNAVRNGFISAEIFWNVYEPDILQRGLFLFREKYALQNILSPRSFFALGARIHKQQMREKKLSVEDLEKQEEQELVLEDLEHTDEDVCKALENFCAGLFRMLVRTRVLTRLLNCKVTWQHGKKRHRLVFRNGAVEKSPTKGQKKSQLPWRNLNLNDYDRMVVLAAELKRMGKLERVLMKASQK